MYESQNDYSMTKLKKKSVPIKEFVLSLESVFLNLDLIKNLCT